MTLPPGPMDPPDNPALPALARMLVTDERFASCRSTVMDANPGMSDEMAGRIVEEGIKFVAACSRNPGTGLAPSRIVDEGWHALILHTAVYAELCTNLGGVFVHHYPGYDPTNYDPPVLDRTREAIAALGWEADPRAVGAAVGRDARPGRGEVPARTGVHHPADAETGTPGRVSP